MIYLNCTMISSVDLAHYGISLAKDWVSGDCVTRLGVEAKTRKFRARFSSCLVLCAVRRAQD